MATSDTTAPSLSYAFLSVNADQIGFLLLFSEAIQPNLGGMSLYSWNTSTGTLGDRISLFSQFVKNSNNLTLLPLTSLSNGNAYQLSLTQGAIQDLSGNLLLLDKLWGVETQIPIFIQLIDLSAGLSLQVWGNPEEGGSIEAKLVSVSVLSGTAKVSYQWQIKTGDTWNNIALANSAALSIPSDQSWVGNEIRVNAQASLTLSGQTQFQSMSLRVANINDAPVTGGATFNTLEDAIAEGNLLASDEDGNALSFLMVSAPQHGQLNLNSVTGAFAYTPSENYHGTDSFTFKVNDGKLDSKVSAVSLFVSALNDPPTAENTSFFADEDTATTGTLSGSDIEGSALTFLKITDPAHGYLSIDAVTGSFKYTPNPNFYGVDAFTFKVNDGSLDSEASVVSILVNSVNDAPVSSATSMVTQEDSTKSGTLVASDTEGSALAFSKVNDPKHGTLTLDSATGHYTYTPATDFSGVDAFSYKVNDGQTDSSESTVSVTVSPVNDAPVANSVTLSSDEDIVLSGRLTGVDIEGSDLTFVQVSQPSHGTLTVNSSTGDFSFLPNPNYSGQDSFLFKVSDGDLHSEFATVLIRVNAVNDAPMVSASAAQTNEDTSLTSSLSALDIEGSVLTYSKVADPQHGKLTLNAETGKYTYTPYSNFNGNDLFSFKASDGALSSEVAEVSVVVNPVNDPPLALSISSSGHEDEIQTGSLSGTDIDKDRLTFAKVTAPSHGTLTLNSATGFYAYSPFANFNGLDVFTYKVNDGELDSEAATVVLTVNPVNDAPEVTSSSISTDEDITKSGTLAATDLEGSPLTFVKVTAPTHGVFTLNSDTGVYTYTPSKNYTGKDAFSVKVNDGNLDSATVSVSISIGSVNDAPLASSESVLTNEDTAVKGVLSASDVEGAALTYLKVSEPGHGTVTLNAQTGAYTYAPVSNYSGNDTFSFKVNDGDLDSETATVSITVSAVNDAPVASAITMITEEDAAKSGSLVAADVEGNTLTFAKVTGPGHGEVTVNEMTGAFTYTPQENYDGLDSFTFKVNDGLLDSEVSTVRITVAAVNDVPVAKAMSIALDEDTAKEGALAGSDAEGGALLYAKVTDPAHGKAVINPRTGQYTYTPDANFHGTDRFSFKVNDGVLDSEVATVIVLVNAVNDAPLSQSETVTGSEDVVIAGKLSGTDAEGGALTYAKTSDPAHGKLILDVATGVYKYIPQAHYEGKDSFTFKVNDGALDSEVGTVSIVLSAVNDAPLANGQTVSGYEDTVKTGVLTGTDIEGSVLTFAKASDPSHGKLLIDPVSGGYTFTPDLNYAGIDRFGFKVNDGAIDSDIEWVVIELSSVNDLPSANSAAASTSEDMPLKGVLSGSDVERNALIFSKVSDPSHGVVVINSKSGVYTYTPDLDYVGFDSFSFKVNDSFGDSPNATLDITVSAVNDEPVAEAMSVYTDEDTAKTGKLIGKDVENDPLTYKKLDDPHHGIVTVNATTGIYTYTPFLNYFGTDSFTFSVSDGFAESQTVTVAVMINPVNDAPTATPALFSTHEDTAFSGSLTANDPDGNSIKFSKVSGPSHGVLVLDESTGYFSYAPSPNDSGSDSFLFSVTDGLLTSDSTLVTLTVASVNDAPVADSFTTILNEDSAKKGLLTGFDLEGDTLTFIKVSDPNHGAISLDALTGAYTYTPESNFFGLDSFSFKTNDGLLDSATQIATIEVVSVNDAPIAKAEILSTPEDTTKTGTLTAWDPEQSILTFVKTNEPNHGALTINTASGAYTYTPFVNFNGTDSFSYKVNDGVFESEAVSVSISVTPVNDAPVAVSSSLTINQDSFLKGFLTGADAEGSPLTFEKVTDPSHGLLEIDPLTGAYVYTPTSHFNGLDTFTFKVSDGSLNSSASVVSVRVRSKAETNRAPSALAIDATTPEDSPKSGVLAGSDPDADNLTYLKVSEPGHGTVTLNAQTGAYTYAPVSNYSGNDTFSFKVNDGDLDSETATVSITVSAVNDAPLASAITMITEEDAAKSGSLVAADVEGNTLTFAKVTGPGHGEVTVNEMTGAFTYTPQENYDGLDSFTFKVNDGLLDSEVSTVRITVAAVNDVPVAKAMSIALDEDTAKEGALAGSDAEGGALLYAKVTDPAHGKAVINPRTGQYTYTPDANFHGTDRFSFKVNDGVLDSEVATVIVLVNAVNDAPLSQSETVTGSEDVVIAGKLSGTDAEGGALTYAKTSDPAHGKLILDVATGVYKYIPQAHYEGKDSFTFKVNDGALDSEVGTVSIVLSAVNDAPLANGQTVSGYEDTVKTGVLTGTDIEGSVLTFAKASDPSHGKLLIDPVSGGYTFTPEPNFHGTDRFSFTVNDGFSVSDFADVELTLAAIDDPASADLSLTGTGLTGTALDLKVSDLQDPDGVLSYTVQWQRMENSGNWSAIDSNSRLSLTLPTDLSWVGSLVRAKLTSIDEEGGQTTIYSPEKLIVSDAYFASIKAYYANQWMDTVHPKLLGNVSVTFPGFQGTTVSLTTLDTHSVVDNDTVKDGRVTFTASAPLPVDVKQAIGLSDILGALKIYLGKDTNSGTTATLGRLAADFDADGLVSLMDVLKLLKYYLGKTDNLQPQWIWMDRQQIGQVDADAGSKVHDFTESSNVEVVGVLRGDVDFSWTGSTFLA